MLLWSRKGCGAPQHQLHVLHELHDEGTKPRVPSCGARGLQKELSHSPVHDVELYFRASGIRH